MANQDTTSWAAILGLIAATGVLSLVWTTAIDSVRSWWRTSKEAKYLAVKTAVSLEAYAIECWRMTMANQSAWENQKTIAYTRLPDAPNIPDDVDWKAISPDIAAMIFTFINDNSMARVLAEHAHRYENNEFDYDDATRTRGRAAWDLAEELRRAFGLPRLEEQRAKMAELYRGTD